MFNLNLKTLPVTLEVGIGSGAGRPAVLGMCPYYSASHASHRYKKIKLNLCDRE